MKPMKSNDCPNPAHDSNTSLESKPLSQRKSIRATQTHPLSQTFSSLSAISPRSIGGKFSQSKRGELFNTVSSPGPGRYESLTKPSAPAYSILGRKAEKVENTPGPASYSPRMLIKSSTSTSIGKAKRTSYMKIQATPGPGRYEHIPYKEAPSWTFHGTNDNSFSITPGPGQYELVDLNRSVGGAELKAKRQELFAVPNGPGPARYESHNTSSQSIKYSIGKAARPGIKSIAPGPGKYDPKIMNHSFSAKFGTEPKKTLQFGKATPGADAYSPKKLEKAPSFSFGLKLSLPLRDSGPGPANYSPEKKIENVAVKIGKSPRFIKKCSEKEVESRPGPGRYNIDREISTGKFFLSKSKKDAILSNTTPGPGSYNI